MLLTKVIPINLIKNRNGLMRGKMANLIFFTAHSGERSSHYSIKMKVSQEFEKQKYINRYKMFQGAQLGGILTK